MIHISLLVLATSASLTFGLPLPTESHKAPSAILIPSPSDEPRWKLPKLPPHDTQDLGPLAESYRHALLGFEQLYPQEQPGSPDAIRDFQAPSHTPGSPKVPLSAPHAQPGLPTALSGNARPLSRKTQSSSASGQLPVAPRISGSDSSSLSNFDQRNSDPCKAPSSKSQMTSSFSGVSLQASSGYPQASGSHAPPSCSQVPAGSLQAQAQSISQPTFQSYGRPSYRIACRECRSKKLGISCNHDRPQCNNCMSLGIPCTYTSTPQYGDHRVILDSCKECFVHNEECNQEKPKCLNCLRANRPCSYVGTESLVWAPLEGTHKYR